MTVLSDQIFRFVSMAEPGNTFSVVRFSGGEGLNRLFEFEIELVSSNTDVDLTEVLENPATFTIVRPDGDVPYSGILKHFDQMHQFGEAVFYRAVLVPKLWWLTLTQHNQVFLNQSAPEFLQAVLLDGGLISSDFVFRLQNTYSQWEYICQYNETHYKFFLRWLEREGMYYYFEQSQGGTRLVVTDTHIAHEFMPQGGTAKYAPPSGLEEQHRDELVRRFFLRQQMVPRNVQLKDYNYRTPTLSVQGKADVADYGRGTFYQYGEHVRTPSEGDSLAKIRAEGFKCREKMFHGESTIPFLRPGYVFTMEEHYRSDFNQDYMTVSVEHSGNQASYFLSGLGRKPSDRDKRQHYENSFIAIPADVQFRSLEQTEKPRITGSMNAWIDASGSDKYAEVDDQGRYKVKLPFDLSGRDDGRASAWIRMAQPYGGSNHGMHFPLHKNTEVLLTFIDGDPDRPIIQSAVPNPEVPSQITNTDNTMCKITTGGQNKIHIEDKEGSQRILLHSPTNQSFVRIGAHNDPGSDPKSESFFGDGIGLVTNDYIKIKAQGQNSVLLGENVSMVGGVDVKTVLGERVDVTLLHRTNVHWGWLTDIKVGGHWTFAGSWKDLRASSNKEVAASQEAVLERQEDVAEHQEVVAQQEEIHADRNVVNGEQSLVVGNRSAMFGEHNGVYGESNDTYAKYTLMVANLGFVCGELQTTVMQHTAKVGVQSTTALSSSIVAQSLSQSAMMMSITATQVQISAGMVIIL